MIIVYLVKVISQTLFSHTFYGQHIFCNNHLMFFIFSNYLYLFSFCRQWQTLPLHENQIAFLNMRDSEEMMHVSYQAQFYLDISPTVYS